MEKVDEKWLKKHGWKCIRDEVTEESHWGGISKTVTRHTVYIKSDGDVTSKNYKRARWDHEYSRNYDISEKTGKEHLRGVTNFYAFDAFGDHFEVTRNLSHRKYDADKIEAACKLCGIEIKYYG